VALGLGENALGAGDPRQIRLDVDVDLADGEAHLALILEDGVPGLADGLPAREQRPAGVNAPHALAVRPQPVHLVEVTALQRPVEARVDLLDLGGVIVGPHAGHDTTTQSPSSSTVSR